LACRTNHVKQHQNLTSRFQLIGNFLSRPKVRVQHYLNVITSRQTTTQTDIPTTLRQLHVSSCPVFVQTER